ncbi:MAG: M14 family zinc carboxypeptidase [Holophagae bacterium]|jgi:hypothetical protein
MNRLPVLTLLVLSFFAAGAASGDRDRGELDRHLEIRIQVDDRSQLLELGTIVAIENYRDGEVWAATTAAQRREIADAGFRWYLAPQRAKDGEITMCPDGWENDAQRSWDCYPSYGQYTALMARYASIYPELCRLVDLGPTTNTDRPHRLWAVVISDNPGLEEDEPEVLLTSTMHGDETTGFVLLLRLIGHLAEGYGDDSAITRLIDETEIWINPNANPDGTYFGGDDDVAEAIRYYTTNMGGNSFVDPNRNFPDPGLDAADPETDCVPECFAETKAMLALAETSAFVLSVNVHGGFEVINYPWDGVRRRHPDDDWLQAISRSWADLAQDDSPPGYLTELENGITHGWDWYKTNGSRQDFMTFYQGGREVTAELSHSKLLPADELDDHWQWNRRAMLDFIGQSLEGIRGVVTDRDGQPLAAVVEVIGRDTEEDGSVVRTDPDVGDYHRLLLPGLYDLRISAPRYWTSEIPGIAVTEGAATVVDVTLQPKLQTRRATRRNVPIDP